VSGVWSPGSLYQLVIEENPKIHYSVVDTNFRGRWTGMTWKTEKIHYRIARPSEISKMKKRKELQALTTDVCSKGINIYDWSWNTRKDKKRFQTIPKRGEKDFEPDGTNKQEIILQEGREAMYTALSFDAGL
jgi:flagellar hook assembly protein FlgD